MSYFTDSMFERMMHGNGCYGGKKSCQFFIGNVIEEGGSGYSSKSSKIVAKKGGKKGGKKK